MATRSRQGFPDFEHIRRQIGNRLRCWVDDLEAQSAVNPKLVRGGIFICLLLSALVCITRAVVGLSGVELFSHDAFMLLDGAWRMQNGQRPHVDFYSHLGFLSYAPTLVGLWISHGAATGYGYGQCLVGLSLSAWAYLLCKKRLGEPLAALMCLAIAITTTAPYALGSPPLHFSPATTYNRYGYSLLGILLIETVMPPERDSPRRSFLSGTSTGALLSILFFLKITYFVFAVFVLLALSFCRTQTKLRWIGICAGALLPSLSVAALYYRFNLLPLLHDLEMIAGAKLIFLDMFAIDVELQDVAVILSLTVMSTLLLFMRKQDQAATSVLVTGITVAITGFFLIFGNWEFVGFPLSIFFAILIVRFLTNDVEPRNNSGNLFRWSILLLSSGIIVACLIPGLLSIVKAIGNWAYTSPQSQPTMNSPRLASFNTVREERWYTLYVNDGLNLLHRLRRPDETIMCLDFSNPFSYGLGSRPAPGGTTVLKYVTNFDDVHRPDAERLFGSADLVMMPSKFYTDGALEQSIPRLYGAYLQTHFSLIGESMYWRLYRNDATWER